jgi:hypothetical protein
LVDYFEPELLGAAYLYYAAHGRGRMNAEFGNAYHSFPQAQVKQ